MPITTKSESGARARVRTWVRARARGRAGDRVRVWQNEDRMRIG